MAVQEKKNVEQNTFQTWDINKSQSSSLNPENQDYWYYCSHSYIIDPSIESDKGSQHRFYRERTHDRKMDTLLCNSYEILHEYSDSKYQLMPDLIRTCKGIMFLRIWKGGLFLGGIGGTGIIMAHQNGNWSAPCAISLGGLQVGLEVGIERVDDILFLNDDAVFKLFIESGHFRLGIDASIALGPFGKDASTNVTDQKSIYAYSFAKGAYIGLSLNGATLSIDHKVNEEFYGRKIGIESIFYGDTSVPSTCSEYMNLKTMLNNFCLSKNMNEFINK